MIHQSRVPHPCRVSPRFAAENGKGGIPRNPNSPTRQELVR